MTNEAEVDWSEYLLIGVLVLILLSGVQCSVNISVKDNTNETSQKESQP